jgi:hypothetical protein
MWHFPRRTRNTAFSILCLRIWRELGDTLLNDLDGILLMIGVAVDAADLLGKANLRNLLRRRPLAYAG